MGAPLAPLLALLALSTASAAGTDLAWVSGRAGGGAARHGARAAPLRRAAPRCALPRRAGAGRRCTRTGCGRCRRR